MRKTLMRPMPLRELLQKALKMPVQGPPEAHQPAKSPEPISSIQKDWPNIVGPSLSKNSQPIKILGSASSATLLVGVSSSVWSNELEFKKREILKNLPKQITDIRYQIVTASSGRI